MFKIQQYANRGVASLLYIYNWDFSKYRNVLESEPAVISGDDYEDCKLQLAALDLLEWTKNNKPEVFEKLQLRMKKEGEKEIDTKLADDILNNSGKYIPTKKEENDQYHGYIINELIKE